MDFVPSAASNSRSITHLANYRNRSQPTIFSDEPSFLTIIIRDGNKQCQSCGNCSCLASRKIVDEYAGGLDRRIPSKSAAIYFRDSRKYTKRGVDRLEVIFGRDSLYLLFEPCQQSAASRKSLNWPK